MTNNTSALTVGDAITTATIQKLLDEVERIRPVLEKYATRAEADRQLTHEAWQAMGDAGLFTMLAPQAYGGLELPISDVMPVWEAVARIDPAAAWNLVMATAVAGFAAFLPAEGARELFARGPTTVAGALFPPGRAIRDEGGWRVTGRVPFASGCHHASWGAMPAVVFDGETPRIDPDTGQPTLLGTFFPRPQAQILDTWHTIGMRGTGSADLALDDVFVPDGRTMVVAPLTNPAAGFEGPLYRLMPFPCILGEATVSVGVAAAAVDALVHLARTKTPAYQTIPLREQLLPQYAAGKARARVEAARDTLHRAAREAYDETVASGKLLSWEAKTRLQLAACFAAEACAEAVRLVHDVAGSAAIRLEQPFERLFRDAHVLTQHSSKSSPRYASAGRLLFGLENDWIWLNF
jgi:alkylation response protein AidB-like acyl-CoA dehydrogenase